MRSAARPLRPRSLHGEPLGAEEIARTRENLHWNSPPFEIPEDIRAAWDNHAQDEGKALAMRTDHYGASAPAKELLKHFGFTADQVVQAIEKSLSA